MSSYSQEEQKKPCFFYCTEILARVRVGFWCTLCIPMMGRITSVVGRKMSTRWRCWLYVLYQTDAQAPTESEYKPLELFGTTFLCFADV